ncbi:MAG: hypothetical protein ACKO0Z_01495 [Betaproteobacteria bacterium]
MTQIEFLDCLNNSGILEAKEEGGKYYWRVSCFTHERTWNEISPALWEALREHHASKAGVKFDDGVTCRWRVMKLDKHIGEK